MFRAWLFASSLSRQLKLNRDPPPKASDGTRMVVWFSASGCALSQIILCPGGLRANISRWEEDRKKKDIPGQLSGKETLRSRSADRRLSGGASSRLRPGSGDRSWSQLRQGLSNCNLSRGPGEHYWGDDPSLLTYLKARVPGLSSIWCGLSQGRHSELGWSNCFQKKPNPTEALDCELSAINTVSSWGDACWVLKRDSGWHITASPAEGLLYWLRHSSFPSYMLSL